MKKKILIAGLVVLLLGLGLGGALSWWRERAAGPFLPGGSADGALAETEGVALVDSAPCARKILEARSASSCEERWALFKSGMASCRDQLVTTSENSFYYEEEVIRLVDCFEADGNGPRAIEVLREARTWGEWKMDHGPTICPGESFVAAALELREKPGSLCLKKEELEAFLTERTRTRRWEALLSEITRAPHVMVVGEWETDTHCAASRQEVLGVLRAAEKKQGPWRISKAPDREEIYFVGEDPPLNFRLAFGFSEADGCFVLSTIDYSIPE